MDNSIKYTNLGDVQVILESKGMFRLGARAIGNKGQYVQCGMQMGSQGH